MAKAQPHPAAISTAVPAEPNGNANGVHDETVPLISEEMRLFIDEKVDKAVKEREEEERRKRAEDLVPPLSLGPQSYEDPRCWSPDYSLLPPDDPARIAWEKGDPIPLARDEHYSKALELVVYLDNLTDK
jgi:hypothetical protein